MLSKTEIKDKVEELICSLTCYNEIKDEKFILHVIVSNSVLAINLITLIEDEFEFEFDDDDINLDFFSSIDAIVELIYANKKYPLP